VCTPVAGANVGPIPSVCTVAVSDYEGCPAVAWQLAILVAPKRDRQSMGHTIHQSQTGMIDVRRF
jgi:hypothetical protein